MDIKTRDYSIDMLRGFAALIVIIGHVFQLFADYQTNLIFNIIFSIQMPLFMLISGYTSSFSKVTTNINQLCKQIYKKTKSLMLPWFMWSLVVYVFLVEKPILEYIGYVSNHMESAFWFLFSLWCITIIVILTNYFTNNIPNLVLRIIARCFYYFIAETVLLCVGIRFGYAFLGIKYTAYYFIFYLLGWAVAHVSTHIEKKKSKLFIEIMSAICLPIYAYLITKVNIFTMSDLFPNIVVRFIISLSGCIIISAFLIKSYSVIKDKVLGKFLVYCGSISLEMYVIQFFVLRLVDVGDASVGTLNGIVSVLIYSVIVTVVTLIVIKFINSNMYTKRFLFGK